MKFGVNTWTWVSPLTTENARTLFPKIKQMGFDLVELALEDPSHLDGPEVGQLLKDNGLSASVCGAFGPTRDLGSDDPALNEEGLAYIRQAVELCAQTGAKVLCGPLYSAVGKARLLPAEQRTEEFNRAADNIRKAAEFAATHGVTLGIEPLNRFETDMVNIAAQAIAMVERINHPNAQVHLDTFHMTIEENSIYDAVKSAEGRLCHVHVSESNRGTPGKGLVAWEQLARSLKEINYSEAVVIETFTPGVKEIAKAAAIWRPLAPSQDALATEGLAFLRNLLAG